MTLPKVATVPLVTDAALKGDPRGTYGFGRPAHGADPQAAYHFAAGTNTSLQPLEHFEDVANAFAETALAEVADQAVAESRAPSDQSLPKNTDDG